MTFQVRHINGSLGSAIAVRDGVAEERKFAVFADAGILDWAFVGGDRGLFISRKWHLAIVDFVAGSVVKRARLRRQADRVAISQDGKRAIAYQCNPGAIAVLDPETLEETGAYNLIETCPDGSFRLLHRTQDDLKASGTPWETIPFSDGPLHAEVGVKAADGLRRMRFTREARAVFRADGTALLPFEFGSNGPRWSETMGATSITPSAWDVRVGIAIVDLEAARLAMRVIRRQVEPSIHTTFPVRSISPDGSHVILQSFDPVAVSKSQDRGIGGRLGELFGLQPGASLAFGLEVWNVSDTPTPADVIAFRALQGATLLPTSTLRCNDNELGEARKEIELLFPGIEAALEGRETQWRLGRDKQREDAYFDPFETRGAPAFRPAFRRVDFPPLFAETVQRWTRRHPRPFSAVPWDDLADRQRSFVASVLQGWSQHSAHAASSMAWIANDRLVTLSRDGLVREISLSAGVGQAFRLVDPDNGASPPFVRWHGVGPELLHVQGRAFAVDLNNARMDFELPVSAFGTGDLEGATPLTYRLVMNVEDYAAEKKQVDRLADAIRRGFVKIDSKQPGSVIAGLRELAREVRNHLNEIVVGRRWLPTLYCRGKPVAEAEFCEIMVADGTDAAVGALDALLTAFLDARGGRGDVWHPDDTTPTMGPVTLALVRMCDPLPRSITRFYAVRDMDHDQWTCEAFMALDLPPQRLLSPDLVALQIRLAIQDICTGNVEADILALYRLPLVRDALHADPSLGEGLAEVIHTQLYAQSAAALSWGSAAGVAGLLAAIADKLDMQNREEATLADELRRRAKAA